MGKIFKSTAFILFFMIMIFVSACKTTEVFVWDPTGVWSVNINYLDYGTSYIETFTLTGSDSSGIVTGYTVYGVLSPQTGTYTKTGNYSITIDFDFWGYGDHLIFDFTGTSSESNPNLISGSGEWYINGMLENNLGWIANKTTNLQ